MIVISTMGYPLLSSKLVTRGIAISICLILSSCGPMGDDATLVDGGNIVATPTPSQTTSTGGKSTSSTSSNDEISRGAALVKRGDVYHQLGKNDEALKSYQEALAIFKTLGDKVAETETLKKIQNIQPSPSP